MKKTLILLIKLYQTIISPALHNLIGVRSACRFPVTCSEYAKNKIENEGVVKGGFSSIARILKCQPFYRGA